MHKDKRVEKKKTVTIKRCLNPVFNESFPFDVPAHVLRETTIIITVMDKDRLSRNDVIGKVDADCSFNQICEIYGLSETFQILSFSDLLVMEERTSRGQTLEGHVEPAAHECGAVARPQSLIRPLHFPFTPTPFDL